VLDVDTVLGVSITRIAAELLVLDVGAPDGVTVDRDAIDLGGAHAALNDVMAAVLGAQGSISAKGHRLRGIGVTWSAGGEAKAGELVTMLTQFGLQNIVAIRPAEATSILTRVSQSPHADTVAPSVAAGEASVSAAADDDMLLARGAALVVAHEAGGGHASGEMEQGPTPRSGHRHLNPTSVSAATILTGGALAVLAATWFWLAPPHANREVPPPAHQEGVAPPPPLEIPTPAGATASPATPEISAPATPSPQRITQANAPVATVPRASRVLVPPGPQNPTHGPADPIGQAPTGDDTPSAAQDPPAADEPPPGPEATPSPPPAPSPEPAPSPQPAPDNQSPAGTPN
jgi:hypothetical protein